MAALVMIAVPLALAGILLGAFLKICVEIRREDRSGSLAGRAPSRIAQSVRNVAGWRRARWAGLR